MGLGRSPPRGHDSTLLMLPFLSSVHDCTVSCPPPTRDPLSTLVVESKKEVRFTCKRNFQYYPNQTYCQTQPITSSQ